MILLTHSLFIHTRCHETRIFQLAVGIAFPPYTWSIASKLVATRILGKDKWFNGATTSISILTLFGAFAWIDTAAAVGGSCWIAMLLYIYACPIAQCLAVLSNRFWPQVR